MIEHNLDVIKSADWIIDLGPEGGDQGGEVIVVGTPEDLLEAADRSYTGEYLRRVLGDERRAPVAGARATTGAAAGSGRARRARSQPAAAPPRPDGRPLSREPRREPCVRARVAVGHASRRGLPCDNLS